MIKMILATLTTIAACLPSNVYAQNKLNVLVKSSNKKGHLVRYFTYGNSSSKVVVTRSDADILTDGDLSKVPVAKRIRDSNRISAVAAGIMINGQWKALKLNPYVVNYTVVPEEKSFLTALKSQKVKLKSIYYAVDIRTGKSGFGIVADTGPGGETTNGEFSVHQIMDLGYNVDKKTGTGGVDANDVVTIIFPDSNGLIKDTEYNDLINQGLQGRLQNRIAEEGAKLLAKYSKDKGSKDLEIVIDEIKRNSSHVDDFD